MRIAGMSKGVGVLFFVGALALAGGALAQMKYTPAEAALVKGYTLTVEKLKRYDAAEQALKRDARSNPALQREQADKDQPATFAEMMAMTKKNPLSMAYFRKEGFSDAEAVLLPAALSNAMLNVAQPSAASEFPASPAQIAFVKSHPSEVQALMKNSE